jgi:hypothetical protein
MDKLAPEARGFVVSLLRALAALQKDQRRRRGRTN